jgi:D-amino-acid dehydrogenase
MHIIVIGGGICGILSAYYLLQQDGARVTLIERRGDVAEETSGANAAQMAYTDVSPIGKPDLFSMLPSLLMGRRPGMMLSSRSPEFLAWSLKLLYHGLPTTYKKNAKTLEPIARRSLRRMEEIVERTGIVLSGRHANKITLYENEAQRTRTRSKSLNPDMHRPLDADALHALIPNFDLEHGGYFGAGIGMGDVSASCPIFCKDLKKYLLSAYPDRFAFLPHVEIAGWKEDGARVRACIDKNGTEYGADAFLLTAATGTNALLKPLGARLPIFPVRGHTIAFDCPNPEAYITCSVADWPQKVLFIPLDGVLAVSGIFRFGVGTEKTDAEDISYIKRCGYNRIPDLTKMNSIARSGLRPCMPDSVPAVRRIGRENVIVNSGHGMYGWTLSAGTAKEAAETAAEAA